MYDLLDRLTSQTTALGSVSYQYDGLDRRTQMTVPNQSPVTYAYDAASRLTSITQSNSVVQFTYDAANRRATLTLPNGVSTQYGYDAASQIIALTYKIGGTTLGDLQYTYDAAGGRIQVGGTFARTGLPAAVGSTTYNANNQQLTFANQSLAYDLNGNLTSDGTNTYTWDARNRLTALGGPAPSSLAYDAMGRRSRKTINGVTTDFMYDGANPVQEQSGSTLTNLLTGLRMDEYFSRGDATSTMFLLADPLGSTVALTDGTGAASTSYTYEPFGAVSGASTNPFQYTGRENDGTGLYAYRARYYHPRFQRFISEDPLRLGGGEPNFYTYVANAPTLLVDPTGELIAQDWFTSPECGGALGSASPLSGRKLTLSDRLTGLLSGILTVLRCDPTLDLLPGVGMAINPRIYASLERQLLKDGPRSIWKALASAEKTLQEHLDKLASAGYKSQIEATIRNIRNQLDTLRKFIKDKGL